MSALGLLSRLRSLGISLTTKDGQLRLKAPPGVLTPELRNELKAQKDEILSLLNDARAAGRSRQAAITRIVRGQHLPLSFAQERLWFLDQLEPNSAVYNIPLGLRLAGELNVPVLQRCLEEIVRRHETLHTRFEAVEGQPVQVIQPVASLEMPLIDLNGLLEPEREREALRLCMEEAKRPFDLSLDLLLRSK